jgi:hypothetical protein
MVVHIRAAVDVEKNGEKAHQTKKISNFQNFVGKIFHKVDRKNFFTMLPQNLINTKFKRVYLGRRGKKNFFKRIILDWGGGSI